MNRNIITFRSVTPAQRAQRTMEKAGIFSSLHRTPRHLQQRGCGYCLWLRQEDTPLALEVLQAQNVGYSQLYTQEDLAL